MADIHIHHGGKRRKQVYSIRCALVVTVRLHLFVLFLFFYACRKCTYCAQSI